MSEQSKGMLDAVFFAHPRSVGESYFEHMGVALRIAFILLGASLAAVIHGLVPCLFKTTASQTIIRLYDRVSTR